MTEKVHKSYLNAGVQVREVQRFDINVGSVSIRFQSKAVATIKHEPGEIATTQFYQIIEKLGGTCYDTF